ncbi:MAG: DegT/DnrJ/EryC1/StrS family aminotransferase [Rivularia sp. ALOHA_DT_140]|nr:DegT/DnrJ/EryC1/StrS family aminotransferase [Rivularia sp. ALOHA_DT_140]
MSNENVKIPFVDLSLQHQLIQKDIRQAIEDVLERGDFILGKAVSDFEADFAASSGAKYGIGVASGTDAIALGLQACNIGAGDEVLLPANTFVATLNAVLRAGAKPIFVDCDPNTALIDLVAAENVITSNTKAIVPVHLYGQVVSPQELVDFAQRHNLMIFEDAAQAHLAHRDGYRAGSLGIAAAYSFYPSKNLGAFGDGGILVTKNQEVAEKMLRLRNYGASKKYFHVEPGTNSRLDTIQAAVLHQKLPHLAGWNAQRLEVAQQYDSELVPLNSLGITPMQNQSGDGHVYHLYVIKVDAKCPLQREEIQEKLQSVGIQTGIHYPIPCHLQPAFKDLGYKVGDFPHSERLAKEILSLPMYPGLSSSQVREVVTTIASAVSERQYKLLHV